MAGVTVVGKMLTMAKDGQGSNSGKGIIARVARVVRVVRELRVSIVTRVARVVLF